MLSPPVRVGRARGQLSLLERLAERVEFKAQVLGDFSSAPTSPQQLLYLGGDLRRDHRSAACRTRRVERFHAPVRYLLTLRMTLCFETPKVRTISTWRQALWQISWAVNIRKEWRSVSV